MKTKIRYFSISTGKWLLVDWFGWETSICSASIQTDLHIKIIESFTADLVQFPLGEQCSNCMTFHAFHNLELALACWTAPASIRLLMSAWLYPASCNTSCVCWPITGCGSKVLTPGVRDRAGAGPASYTPREFFRNVLLVWLWGWAGASSISRIGSTHASKSRNTSVHSSRVFDRKISVNNVFVLLLSPNCGTLSGSSWRPATQREASITSSDFQL